MAEMGSMACLHGLDRCRLHSCGAMFESVDHLEKYVFEKKSGSFCTFSFCVLEGGTMQY